MLLILNYLPLDDIITTLFGGSMSQSDAYSLFTAVAQLWALAFVLNAVYRFVVGRI